MTAIIFLIPISIGLGIMALAGFVWSVAARQYENMDSDAHRILTAEDIPLSEAEKAMLNDPDVQW
ncbi:cbb3-type cytochrome oxidase assembly protein CcoS [Roseobacter sp. YSTF-M11]|uniref:Cbb3-type cytochrome oxidase assembly protein CcoS n=1 Tax=Roseobacter insulae TaxID=2859783 RepID=A0A9X1JZS0_9RHOB|nr:cbb3-type cytochrome oxidase assembly protein CcoS [Roseobacter insulae]MBW4707459.1 cbb3-type cytochrome oxidase assembly protein CcoS [Roseobacter insulae]